MDEDMNTADDDNATPVGPRRGYPKRMTIIMLTVTAIIIAVAIAQWIRV